MRLYERATIRIALSCRLRNVLHDHVRFSYLVRGTVEKLEVVNKKWVRVKTVPGASVDGGVSLQVSAFVSKTL